MIEEYKHLVEPEDEVDKEFVEALTPLVMDELEKTTGKGGRVEILSWLPVHRELQVREVLRAFCKTRQSVL